MNPLQTKSILLHCLSILTAPLLLAHSVWLEPLPSGELSVRFGEWGEEVEKSPGALDSLTEILAKEAEIALKAAKHDDHFLLEKSKAASAVTASTGYPVMKRSGAARLPLFHARWWPSGDALVGKPVTCLDLLPTANPLEIAVFFDGKPIGVGQKLTLHVPETADTDLTTDDRGIVILPKSEKPGLYQLSLAKYSETANGEFRGESYNVISHNASLTWKIEKP